MSSILWLNSKIEFIFNENRKNSLKDDMINDKRLLIDND